MNKTSLLARTAELPPSDLEDGQEKERGKTSRVGLIGTECLRVQDPWAITE